MKRIFSIVLMVCLFSTMFITSSLAATEFIAVASQDCDGTFRRDSSGKGPLQNGIEYHYANAGAAGAANATQEKAHSGETSVKVISTSKDSVNPQVGTKAYMDNSKMEVGQTYQISAWVYYDPAYSNDETHKVSIMALNGTTYTTFNSKEYTVKTGEWTKITTDMFTYNSTYQKNTVNIRVQSNTKAEIVDGKTAQQDVLYVDDFAIEQSASTSTFKDVAKKEKTIDFEVSSITSFTKGFDWQAGGTFDGTVTLSSAENNTVDGSKSLFVNGRKSTSDRIKFLDFYSNTALNEIYKVSFYIKSYGNNSENALFRVGGMSNEDYAFCDQPIYVNAQNDEWTKVEYSYIVTKDTKGNVVDELMIDQLSDNNYVVNGCCEGYYIDDISAEKVETPAYIASSNGISNYKFVSLITVDPATFADGEGDIIIALYNDNNDLLGVSSIPYEADTETYKVFLRSERYTEVTKAKLFQWTSLDSLNPLAGSIEFAKAQ